VQRPGIVCERADMSEFTGDVLQWVKDKIERSCLVISEISGANPNVYLELGYAWGHEIPTILMIREGNKVPFNVQGQRLLKYDTVTELSLKMEKEIESLNPQFQLWV
tara:strand:- start:211 stop:531 length:321 start_codon:yes stop_codon:yes gene_type:complete